MSDALEALKSQIEEIGNQIRDIKDGGNNNGDASQIIPSLVANLNTLKQEYANQNGGLGVDGKPYQPPLSKAEKKKLEKEKKAAAAAASTVRLGLK